MKKTEVGLAGSSEGTGGPELKKMKVEGARKPRGPLKKPDEAKGAIMENGKPKKEKDKPKKPPPGTRRARIDEDGG